MPVPAWKNLIWNSGPGWIQAAVTLGGGTLVSSLYLGVIGGYEFLWLQPLAMLCGVVMLAALNHVTLSQADPAVDRPFVMTKKLVSPLLAWGWLLGAMVANVVFCASQFALATDAIQGNLKIPVANPFVVTSILFAVAIMLIWWFSAEGLISEWVNNIIKLLVALIVVSFMAVVVVLMVSGEIQWVDIGDGLKPNFSLLFQPSRIYSPYIADAGAYAGYWRDTIASSQRIIIIGAFGTAVGINMTFLVPYVLLKRKWNRDQRTWSQIDLVCGLLIPYVLAATCLVLATASQFHGRADAVVSERALHEVLDRRLTAEFPDFSDLSPEAKQAKRRSASTADLQLSTMLAKRNANELAEALTPFLGNWSQLIFGVGVLAMAISTMLVHMMINGYALSEAFNRLGQRSWFMAGAAIPAVSGLLSPVIWNGTVKSAIVLPASVIATTMLPVAYLIFILLFNSDRVRHHRKTAGTWLYILAMIIATLVASFASIWALAGKLTSNNPREFGFGLAGLIILAVVVVIGLIQFRQRQAGAQ